MLYVVFMHELLTTTQMYEADRLAVAGGVPSIVLMENAGAAIVRSLLEHWKTAHNVLILCGPGNNGGDGYVAARLLVDQGLSVRLVSVLPDVRLSGDAAITAGRYDGVVEGLAKDISVESLIDDSSNFDVVVDAMFGAGLSRDLDGGIARLVAAVNDNDTPVLSVDVPSGIDGDTGAVCGCAVKGDVTVTFFRRKPGHLLLPGREHCRCLQIADIGIDDQVLSEIKPHCFANEPVLWRGKMPAVEIDQHKYSRGHVVSVSGGYCKTGAARLAAMGALRAGAGLVSVASPPDALNENAAHLTAIMIRAFENSASLATLLADKRLNSVVIGPGLGIGEQKRECIEAVLSSGAKAVIDADGITGFSNELDAGAAQRLFSAIKALPDRDVVLTPHEGEFKRLFGLTEGSKLEKAASAARLSGATIVYKGADTVIASPCPEQQNLVINGNAPANLATAGSGDVLAGIIAGLMAQGLSGFDAACAGVWMHGEAARLFGPGLISEDLPHMLPRVWSELK